jgi:glutamate-1-semialdehyde aminotransferase
LARAFTGRDYVAFPKSHPFFSFDDWFIGSTLTRAGIPSASLKMSLRYDFNDPDSLARLFKEFPDQIACVITEPEEINPGPPDFLRAVQDITRANGAIFILDEMVTGFRAGFPGYYTEHGLTPDLTTWGKGIGNGFSFCALAGRADIMDLGGIKQKPDPRVFLLSSTHGGEAHSLAAARVVIDIFKTQDVIGRHRQIISELADGMKRLITARNLESHVQLWVSSWRIIVLTLDVNGKADSTLRTLFCQEMIGHGVLTQGSFLPCFTHTDADIAQILLGFEKACDVLNYAIQHGVDDLLVGPAARPVFRKYNGCTEICPATPCPNEQRCKHA